METSTEQALTSNIQTCLGKEIAELSLKAKGGVNNAYFVKTVDKKTYIVKQERPDKTFQPQNTLTVEAAVARELCKRNLSIPIPSPVFVSEEQKMYGYEYIEGQTLREAWSTLTEQERIDTCHTLGYFHAEIGKKVSKETSEQLGIKIDPSNDVHPDILKEYLELMQDPAVPAHFKRVAEQAKKMFEKAQEPTFFQFIHNDGHPENILMKDKKIVGMIDFGNAEYGEVAKEFSRYIRDLPDHFEHIVSAYEKASGNTLSYPRLISHAMLADFIDIVEEYRKGEAGQTNAETSMSTHEKLMAKYK